MFPRELNRMGTHPDPATTFLSNSAIVTPSYLHERREKQERNSWAMPRLPKKKNTGQRQRVHAQLGGDAGGHRVRGVALARRLAVRLKVVAGTVVARHLGQTHGLQQAVGIDVVGLVVPKNVPTGKDNGQGKRSLTVGSARECPTCTEVIVRVTHMPMPARHSSTISSISSSPSILAPPEISQNWFAFARASARRALVTVEPRCTTSKPLAWLTHHSHAGPQSQQQIHFTDCPAQRFNITFPSLTNDAQRATPGASALPAYLQGCPWVAEVERRVPILLQDDHLEAREGPGHTQVKLRARSVARRIQLGTRGTQHPRCTGEQLVGVLGTASAVGAPEAARSVNGDHLAMKKTRGEGGARERVDELVRKISHGCAEIDIPM